MKVNVIGEQISQDEINAYIEYGKKKYSDREIIGMTVKIDGEYVDLQYDFTKPVDSKSGGSSAEIQTGNFSLIG